MSNEKGNESAPKKAHPNIGATMEGGKRHARRYDLVEEMQFLFVRVVRVRHLPNLHDLYVEIKIGNIQVITGFFKDSYELDQVFAFEQDKLQASDENVEIFVKNMTELVIGHVNFLHCEAPKRVPPEPSLAPQWYRLVDQKEGKHLDRGDIMLSLWWGTQADEHFPHAWCSDSSKIGGDSIGFTRSKVYISPILWYLRVNVIQAEDLLLRYHPETSDIFVQVELGSFRLRTSLSKIKSGNEKPFWNEDLMFVAQEPFDETLVLSVEQGTLENHVSLGTHMLQLNKVAKRSNTAAVDSLWYDLSWPGILETAEDVKFASKLNARISLDGAYHVMDEPIEYCSDFRPSSKNLWKSSIGVLELGIIKATDLMPMKLGGRTDAYCVVKYGQKWVRTRTIVDSLSPKWNEQYIWEVYEPFTVITIAVFDNNQLDTEMRDRGEADVMLAKVRIRLSTLHHNKVYTHSYPLIGLHSSGVKKMGEIHLAVRFSWQYASSLNMCQLYGSPLFPKHHYRFLLSPIQFDNLRNQAAQVIAKSLSRTEPPLGREVVYQMLDMKSNMWSMRKGIINYNRVMSFISDFIAFWKWLKDIRYWKNPTTTLLFHFQCILLLLYPEIIMPLMCFYFFWIGVKSYFKRLKHPCHIDATLSGADTTTPEDLDEELDVFPTEVGSESLRMRYDRLRQIGGNIHRLANNIATIGEKVQSLSSWRDPRATTLFLLFCVGGFLVALMVPVKVIIFIMMGFYLRHPKFRYIKPWIAENFFDRMPSKQAFIL